MHRNLTGERMKNLVVLGVLAPVFAGAAPIVNRSRAR